ncbi:hypothetical protein FXO37_27478 [Capsicum annuum]|nr:hypothetical protein FXO37_27478 [Capsicum annuum]
MAIKFNSLNFVVLSTVIVTFAFYHVFAINDDQKLLNSLDRVTNTGGWQLIKDSKDSKVVNIAKFAVNAENTRSEGRDYKLVSVLNGKFQAANNGITYQLVIVTTEFDVTEKYIVIVFDNPKDNVRKLISFD